MGEECLRGMGFGKRFFRTSCTLCEMFPRQIVCHKGYAPLPHPLSSPLAKGAVKPCAKPLSKAADKSAVKSAAI